MPEDDIPTVTINLDNLEKFRSATQDGGSFLCRAIPPKKSDEPYPVPLDGAFQLGPDMYKQFADAPELANVVQALVHRDYAWASDFSIVALWKRNGGQNQGRNIFAKLVKTSALVAHFSHADYILWLAADHARDYRLTHLQVEAFVHQELGHMVPTDGAPGIVGYEFEGFAQTLLLYGAFTENLREAAATFQQLPLFDFGKGS